MSKGEVGGGEKSIKRIFSYIAVYQNCTAQDIANGVGLARQTVYSYINVLKRRGMITEHRLDGTARRFFRVT